MKSIFSMSLGALSVIYLSGCAVVPLVSLGLGGVNIYNQLNPEKNVTIEIDALGAEKIRSQLVGVNSIAILAKDTSAVSFSDVWEKAGRQATIISGEIDPASMSISQARGVLASACRTGIQAAAYGRAGDVDVNRLGIIIGKAEATMNADIYIFNCKNRKIESSPVVISFNALGQDGSQADRSIGAGLAAKLLEIGK